MHRCGLSRNISISQKRTIWVTQQTLQFFLSILPFYLPALGLTNTRLTLSENRQTHTYSTLIHIYRSKQWDSKEYYQRDLSSERPRDCSILELCRNICILQQPFHCSVGLSHPDECFWFFGIRWLMLNCLWSRNLTNDALILEAAALLQNKTGSTDAK